MHSVICDLVSGLLNLWDRSNVECWKQTSLRGGRAYIKVVVERWLSETPSICILYNYSVLICLFSSDNKIFILNEQCSLIVVWYLGNLPSCRLSLKCLDLNHNIQDSLLHLVNPALPSLIAATILRISYHERGLLIFQEHGWRTRDNSYSSFNASFIFYTD